MIKKRGLPLLTLLLLISLLISSLLNLFLFNQGKQYYLQLNETRLDPLGLNYYPSTLEENKLIESHKFKVVFLGDSRAANWPPPANLTDFEFINRGIGAQTSTQILYRFDHHIKNLRPQVVILQVGINDLKTIPILPERKESIIANCKANIQETVTRSINSGAIVILTTIFPVSKVSWERRLFWSSEVSQAVDEVNRFILSLDAPDIIIFDSYSILAKNGITKDEYFQDMLHLNRSGYEALNIELAHLLISLR